MTTDTIEPELVMSHWLLVAQDPKRCPTVGSVAFQDIPMLQMVQECRLERGRATVGLMLAEGLRVVRGLNVCGTCGCFLPVSADESGVPVTFAVLAEGGSHDAVSLTLCGVCRVVNVGNWSHGSA